MFVFQGYKKAKVVTCTVCYRIPSDKCRKAWTSKYNVLIYQSYKYPFLVSTLFAQSDSPFLEI